MPRAILVVSLVVTLFAAAADPFTATLFTSLNYTNLSPGPDLRIGTSDDTTDFGAASGPNSPGAVSFALLKPSGGIPADGTDFTYILFVTGSLQFTADLGASTASDLVLNITGGTLDSTTDFGFPVNGGASTPVTGTAHMNPMTGAATIALTGTFTPQSTPSFPLTNQTLTTDAGKGLIVFAPKFGASGNDYVDHVLAPLVPPNATAIAFFEFTGRVQGTACCDQWPTRGVLAAYTTDDLGCTDFVSCLANAGCHTFDLCEPALASALPDTSVVSKKSRATAKRLHALDVAARKLFDKTIGASAAKQKRFYRRAKSSLNALLKLATKADGKHKLGVALAPIQAAVTKLLGFIPAS